MARRTWAENGFFQCFHSLGKDSCSWPQFFRHVAKALGGAAPRLFRPMYAQANMGHPSREEGFVLSSHLCEADKFRQRSSLSRVMGFVCRPTAEFCVGRPARLTFDPKVANTWVEWLPEKMKTTALPCCRAHWTC